MKTTTSRLFYLSVIVGALTYVICIIIGMFLYPGGAQSDPAGGPFTPGYSLWGNTLSDIGRMVAINGEPNLKSAIFFFTGTGIYGLALLLFAIKFPTAFPDSGQGKTLANIGRVVGIIAALGTLVYTFAPTDTMELLHLLGVYFAYLGTFSFTLLFGIAVYRNANISNLAGIILAGFSVLYFASLVVLIMDLSVPMTMFMQKAGRLLMILVLLSIAAMERKRLSN